MKKIAMLVLLAASVSQAAAEDAKVNFDGRNGTPSFASLLNGAITAPAAPAPAAAGLPKGAVPVREIRINVVMKRPGSVTKESVVCAPVKGRPAIDGCAKGSDLSKLTAKDVSGMSLRKYFAAENPVGDLMAQTRHSYTNQSGPQTFSCTDACGKWDWAVTVSPFPPYLEEVSWTCVEDSHECECVAGCY